LKNFNKLLLVLIVLIGVSSCVTTKKKDAELSSFKKLYHNTTSQYNGYFNADILLQKSIMGLEQNIQDNYTQILEIFPYVASSKAKSVAGDLDKAIEKVSVVIALHRQSDWTDDCYLLMGQAQYTKQDYETAEETLVFMTDHFDPNNPKNWKSNKKRKKTKKERKKEKKEKDKVRKDKKKKKEKERKLKKKEREKKIKAAKKKKKANKKRRKKKGKKGKKKKSKKEEVKETPQVTTETVKPEEDKKEEKKEDKKPPKVNDGDLLHKRPVFQDAKLWLAKTYIEREKFDLAENILMNLDNNPKTFKDVRKELAPTFAYFYLKQKNFPKAIEQLQKAILLEKKKNKKARYAYIIGQIYQKENDNTNAVAFFNKAKKYSNNYEMEFSAQLNILETGYKTGKFTKAQTIKKLERFLKDAKNIEYKDKIYFSLAEVALADNQNSAAIDYYKKSIAANTNNVPQRTESCYRLAHLLYNAENYVDSKSYFDSTMIVMTKFDDRYFEVKRYAENLTDIALNLEIVQLNDSLLMVSAMTNDQKKDLVKKLKKEEAKAKAEAKDKMATGKVQNDRGGIASRNLQSAGIGRRPSSFSSTKSNFFAYNPKALKKGKKDFKKVWGDRKLEDNWRLKSKQTGISNEDLAENEDTDSSNDVSESDMQRLLKGVPTNEAEKIKTKENIQDALMALGRLFRERLEKNEKTVEVLEDHLLKKYPETKHELDAWYYLYLAHTDLGNRSRAQDYYDKITKKYPETTYARVLSDPNFVGDSQKEAQKLEDFYIQTYALIQSNNYKKAYEKIKISDKLFGKENSYRGKFALLGAMSLGNMNGKDAYITELKDVIVKFPKSPVEKRAKEILRLLGDKSIKAPTANNNAKKFTYDEKKIQYIIIPIDDQGSMKLSDIKSEIARFNRKFFKSKKLRVSTIYLGTDTDHPIIIIRKFKKLKDAMKYYKDAEDEGDKFLTADVKYKMYVLTQNSYRQILRAKSLDGYDAFFKEMYLKE